MSMSNAGILKLQADLLPDALRDTEKERLSAMLAGEVEQLAECLAPTLIYVHSSGTTDDKTSYLAPIRSGVLRYRSMHYIVRQVALLTANSVMAIGTLKAIAAVSGNEVPIDTIFSAGWSLTDRWRLALWYSGHVGQG